MVQISVPLLNKPDAIEGAFEINGMTYTLIADASGEDTVLIVSDSGGGALIRFDTGEIFGRYADYPPEKGLITTEEATFTAENASAALKIIVQNAGFVKTPDITDENPRYMYW